MGAFESDLNVRPISIEEFGGLAKALEDEESGATEMGIDGLGEIAERVRRSTVLGAAGRARQRIWSDLVE